MTMLTAQQRALIDFERSWWLRPGPKDQSIEFDLGLTAEDYYAYILRLIPEPAAYAYDPLTVLRVRAMIETVQSATGTAS